MIQIEIIEKDNEEDLVNDVNYFLEQLEDHLFMEIKYHITSNFSKKLYSAMIIYKVQ